VKLGELKWLLSLPDVNDNSYCPHYLKTLWILKHWMKNYKGNFNVYFENWKEYIVANCNSCHRISFMKRRFAGLIFFRSELYLGIWCDFDLASSLICGNKMPTRCNRGFLFQILLLAQHDSGTTIHIIRSSRVLYSGCCLWYFVLWFSSCWSGVELRVMCPVCRMLQPLLHLVGIWFPHIWKYSKQSTRVT